jgi:hypothetical protein
MRRRAKSTNCPVCQEPKEKPWHLVCPYCWVKVPLPDQADVYRLYKTARGSTKHRMKCREVVYALFEAKHAAGARK